MGDFTKFRTVIIELTELFLELATTEQEKLQAITKNNLKGLEESMKQEQVGIMKLKGLEKIREESQAALGLSGMSFKEVIENLDGQQVLDLSQLYTNLEEALSLFNQNAESAKTAIETNLYSIESALEQLNEKENTNKTKEDAETKRPKSFSSTRV